MTATSHAIIGAVIAAKIGYPLLAVPMALASHFAADMFPHWDTGTHWRKKTANRFLTESAFDVILGFVLSYVLIIILFPATSIPYALFIIIVSQLPDWITAPYLFLNIKAKPFLGLYNFQHKFNNKLDKPWGIITQVVLLAVLLILAKIF